MSRAVAVPFIVPAHLEARQRTASDPATSIWVSANAGSGKTHVLTQRVIRLLLGGVAPAKILCLTFTKAASAQMATRVFATLSTWTVMDDSDLRKEILATGAPPPNSADLLLARRLFTRTVETPGGLKIQTIHAFCERLLHLFPFEANVPARFEVADERRMQEMLSLARRAAVAALKDSAELALVADVAGAFGLDRLLGPAMAPRAATLRAVPPDGVDPQMALAARLGGTFASVAAVRRAMLDDGLGPTRRLAIADVLDGGAASDKTNAGRLREAAALAGRGDFAEAIDVYMTIFFTGTGERRSRLSTNRIAASRPDIAADLAAEGERLDALKDQFKIAETVERTRALMKIVDAIIDRYEAAKIAQGLLDFDDLIERTLALLEHSSSGWVLHKLDAGIDHVLVDEAQDTSEPQWRILEKLTGDFASGEGARQHDRSFFVVGDDKQSIFSFQGAAPQKFDEMRMAFERRFRAGRKPFERVELKTSFRSVPGVLAAVDTIFDGHAAHSDGLVPLGQIWPTHESIRARLPGLVEVWPRLGAIASPDPAEWTIPLDTPAENDPVNVVADRVARKIKALIATDSKDRVHDGRGEAPRPIRAGDILVLVRTRGAFFEAVIRALKHHYVDVAGADRLDVANHIAVMDLVAAGLTALMPADDLSLACLLKSPLFGLTDEDLIALAPNRRGTLFTALADSSTPSHREAHATIARWAARAARVTPFAFYVELLGRDRGRFLMERRLGPEAHDAIDEFLRLALGHEREGAPSLGAFLADVEALESSIKRDMEAPGDAVRVMTVHAAKGLEAKIVFLPDTCAVPAPTLDPTVFDLHEGSGQSPLLAWSPRKGDDPPAVEVARTAQRKATMREYRRLLYVALTRAEERLYIAGFYNTREPPGDCWNTMIEIAFPDAETIEAPWGDGDFVKRIVTLGTATGVAPIENSRADQRDLGLPPDWLSRHVAAPAGAAPLRPSRLRLEGGATERREGLTFGSALHLLLQYLPSLPVDRRATAARTYLEARRTTIPETMHDDLVAEALGVIAHPDLAALFGPAARAEVAVVGRLVQGDGTSRDVRGAVDRLVVLPERVIVADFKTGAPEAEPPRAYVEQLALYRRVLATLWPDRPLTMWLVWTRGPVVVELDPAILDATVAAIL